MSASACSFCSRYAGMFVEKGLPENLLFIGTFTAYEVCVYG